MGIAISSYEWKTLPLVAPLPGAYINFKIRIAALAVNQFFEEFIWCDWFEFNITRT